MYHIFTKTDINSDKKNYTEYNEFVDYQINMQYDVGTSLVKISQVNQIKMNCTHPK